MKKIKDILPRCARVTAILLQRRDTKNSRNYTHQCLWCTIEIVEKDQQDYKHPEKQIFNSANDWVNNERIAFFQDIIFLTSDVLGKLPQYFEIDHCQVIYPDIEYIEEPNSANEMLIVNSYNQSSYYLSSILPTRNDVRYIKTWIDYNRVIEQQIIQSSKLSLQIKLLTEKHLGFNLAQMPYHLGNIYFVSYHPSLRSIDLCSSCTPNGLFVKINRRKGKRQNFLLRVADYHQNGIMIYERDFLLKNQQDYSFIELPVEPHRISVRLFDGDGDVIYNQDNISFIRSVNLEMHTHAKTIRLNIQNRDGSSENKEISKYVPVDRQISAPHCSIEEYFSNQFSKIDLSVNTFYFFNGDKLKKRDNVEMAKDIIASILDMAKDVCYICDPYFSSRDFLNFVFPIKNLIVPVRILTSKEFMCRHYDEKGQLISNEYMEEERSLLNIIYKYNEIVGDEKASCRVLLGKSAVHDRFIVCDSNVWCLGSSFSEFGARATTLYKIPNASCRPVRLQIEKWWSDGVNTKSLRDYVEDN